MIGVVCEDDFLYIMLVFYLFNEMWLIWFLVDYFEMVNVFWIVNCLVVMIVLIWIVFSSFKLVVFDLKIYFIKKVLR